MQRKKRYKVADGASYTCATHGYVMLKHEGRWRKRSHVVIEAQLGRRLGLNEVVHHIDEDKTNDHPSNLELIDRAEHTRLHNSGKKRNAETRAKQRVAAVATAAAPAERKRRSQRAKRQHQNRMFGY